MKFSDASITQCCQKKILESTCITVLSIQMKNNKVISKRGKSERGHRNGTIGLFSIIQLSDVDAGRIHA